MRARTSAITICLLCACSLRAIAAPLPTIDVHPDGRGRAAIEWPREVPLRFETWIVRDNWSRIDQQWLLRDRKHDPADASGTRGVRGHFDLGDQRTVRFDERIGPTRVDYALTAEDEIVGLTGIYWAAALPIDSYGGGSVQIGETTIALPGEKRDPPQLGEATADHVTIRCADGSIAVELTFDAPRIVRVQDARAFGEASYQLVVPMTEQPMPRDAVAKLGITFATKIAAHASDAHITIDAPRALNRFDGIGGNFVYGLDDATAGFVLDALPAPAWARIGMDLREWEPTNDNGDPSFTNVAALSARDVAGSPLRRKIELAQALAARCEGRLIATVWYPPEWTFAQPLDHAWRESPGRVPRERWDELCESIVSYLTYLKTRGVEPMFVSLNEPDLGVYVLQDGQEMRDWTKQLGAALRDAKLTTRILLGDVADLDKGWTTIAPTLADAEARSFVGGLAYHPWAGQNELWKQWADAAHELNVPLFATEMGAEADAWRDGSFDAPLYALRLARRYVEQMRDARTLALLEWEWTNDFPLTRRAADGSMTLSPRGELLRQLAGVPAGASVVASTSDQPNLVVAAIANDSWIAVHLVNLDASRAATLGGFPAWARRVRVSSVDPIQGARAVTEADVHDGAVRLQLEEGAVTTVVAQRD